MDIKALPHRIDAAIRFFLYLLVFWLPYSPAVIESCVGISLILWLIKRSLLKTFKPQTTTLNGPIAFFLFACLVSLWGSFHPEQSTRGFLTKTLEWFIVYFLAVEVFTQKKHITTVLVILSITSLATAFDGIIQYYVTGRDIFMGRIIPREDPIARSGATAAFKHANILGAYLTFVIPLMLAAVFCFSKRYMKFLAGFTVVMSLWLLLITFSRGAWLAVMGGSLLSLWMVQRKIFFAGASVFLIIIFSGFIFLSPQTKSTLRVTTENLSNSLSYRLGLWEDSWKMIQDKPAFGHGLNTFMPLFQEYRRKYLDKFDFGPTYAHNSFIQLTVETGLVGLAGFMWILLRLFKNVIAQITQIRHNNPSKILLTSLIAGVFGFLIQSGVDTNFYSLQPSVLFWLMAGILIAQQRLLLTEQPETKVI